MHTSNFLGQSGFLSSVWETEEEWKMRVVYICFFTFQCASCYFVFLIVILRMSMIRNPIDFATFHKKVAKPWCIMIWIFIVVMNVLITICLSPGVSGTNAFLRHGLIYVRCHLGVTLPVVFSISVNIYLSVYLAKGMVSVNNLTNQEQNYKASFQKLINGLVIWMIVCNAPFIAWLHYTLQYENMISWTGAGGV